MEHWVSLDCATKRVTLRTKEDNEIVMIGERRDYLSNVISTLVAEKLIRKGCEVYLFFISEITPTKLALNDIRII